jgi:uncharacterized damage-inducible protein DinB
MGRARHRRTPAAERTGRPFSSSGRTRYPIGTAREDEMSQEIHRLAVRFEDANRQVIAAIEARTDEQLRALCPAERCTVAALACHVADVHALGADWIRTMLAGRPLPPLTMDMVDRINAEQFALNANRTKAEALERLRRNGDEAVTLLRGLGDADLGRTTPFALFGGPTISVRQVIDLVLIADPVGHLASIRAAVAAPALS